MVDFVARPSAAVRARNSSFWVSPARVAMLNGQGLGGGAGSATCRLRLLVPQPISRACRCRAAARSSHPARTRALRVPKLANVRDLQLLTGWPREVWPCVAARQQRDAA